jgi:hypothetical protein
LTLIQEILTARGFEYGLERTPHGTTRFTVVMPTARAAAERALGDQVTGHG